MLMRPASSLLVKLSLGPDLGPTGGAMCTGTAAQLRAALCEHVTVSVIRLAYVDGIVLNWECWNGRRDCSSSCTRTVFRRLRNSENPDHLLFDGAPPVPDLGSLRTRHELGFLLTRKTKAMRRIARMSSWHSLPALCSQPVPPHIIAHLGPEFSPTERCCGRIYRNAEKYLRLCEPGHKRWDGSDYR